jgi:hypothetical protein
MQYLRLVSGETLIEFHNSWKGVESVYANGQLMTQKSSIWGTSHYFQVQEDDRLVKFILTTKIGANMQVMIDLIRDGEPVECNRPIPYGSMPEKPHLKLKETALKHLADFDLEAALEDLNEAAKMAPKDPELYFYMACAHSIMERAWEGFNCLKKAVALGLNDQDRIRTHDKLAYLRLHPAFEAFRNSGFTRIEKAYLKAPAKLELSKL